MPTCPTIIFRDAPRPRSSRRQSRSSPPGRAACGSCSTSQYLVEDGERCILIDAGPAGSIGQTGALPQALGALGLQRDQIDAVIVTHMHQDHMGG
jgi:glyoxylase-like metal-dependent hydrolase (beta-lactamase superfamily II)